MRFRNFLFLLALFFVGFVSATSSYSVNNVQYTNPSIGDIYSNSDINLYWPGLGNSENGDMDCDAVSDFWIGITPEGCSPSVVTSDLLEEQDVPVFCQLYAVQINPLIEVFSIDSISFKGDYPDGVSGVSFYPAQAAIKSQKTLTGTPVTSNIGYVVILLKQEKVEANMSDWISGNLTATIKYDAESAFGTGRSQYYLEDTQGEENLIENSFWNGMGYLRLKGIGNDEASIEVMSDKDSVFRTVNLKAGETSNTIYFPGYYCRAGLKVKLNSFVAAESSALLSVDGDDIWVRRGSSFLNGKCRVSSLTVKENGTGNLKISCSGESFSLTVGSSGESGALIDNAVNKNITDSFKIANDTVEELIVKYRSEKKELLDTTYGEEALFEQINVAGEAGQFASQMALASLFIESYPNSALVGSVEDKVVNLGKYDYKYASKSLYVGNDYHVISVSKFRNVSKDDKRVSIVFGGQSYERKEGERIDVGSDYILVSGIKRDRVVLKYYENGKYKSPSVSLKEDEYGSLNGKDVLVDDIEVSEVAYVSLIPVVNDKSSEANFSFKIGVEKRAIQLSPEKTEEMIRNLNKSIEDWKEINSKLGDLVTGLKGACFSTSAFLTVKNMISGFNGETTARQKVMREYKDICSTKYSDMSKTECYNELSNDIDADVERMKVSLNDANKKMDSVLDKYEKNGVISDRDAYLSELKQEVPSDWEHEGLTRDDLTSSSQVGAVLLFSSLSESGVSGVALMSAQREMGESLESVVSAKETLNKKNEVVNNLASVLGVEGVSAGEIVAIESKDVKYASWGGKVGSDYGLTGNDASKKVQLVTKSEKSGYYLLVLSETSSYYNVEKVLEVKDKEWVDSDEDFNVLFYRQEESSKKCVNVWEGASSVLSYYESGSAKGRPAVVPFDLEKGWYAKVSSDAYVDSGDFSKFDLCNIYNDKTYGTSDDECQTFVSNTAASIESIGGCVMSEKEVSDLYSKARSAILEAEGQYGKTSVTINGNPMTVGKPSATSTSYECQDFMSPSDCKLLFNVCDPVICPASRCDMGGKMAVSDVIQTGIVGSILLCLPNVKEGIMIPVCLTGIHAGIESFVSILESEMACLQTSLESGESVGICDEVTSIYLCEFFWNQFSSFFDKVIPSILNYVMGGNQNVRGGGEYLLVSDAWEGAQDSISYFKNVYAQNAFAAFKVKSTAQAGGKVCKSFIGTTVPTSSDMIDELLEPESPTQFYAYFSSDTFTEATVPVTAQYKVYYHIYAGEDQGIQYKVYLQDPPTTSYYASHQTVDVGSGYLAAGESADESVDFTAPEGYKQLCVNINGDVECDFKSVSTSIASDYVSSKYVEDEISNSDVTTEDECISGSGSVWSLASLNLQAGVEEMVDGDISLNGIVRVCATSNPGNSVGDSGRWREVGYCGEESMRCWLDYTSVEESLETVAAIEGTDVEELSNAAGILASEEGAMSYEDVSDLLINLESRIEKLRKSGLELRNFKTDLEVLDIVAKLERIGRIGDDNVGEGTNANRARAYMLKARLYQNVVREFLKSLVPKITECQQTCVTLTFSDSSETMTEAECSSRNNGKYLESVENGCCCYGSVGSNEDDYDIDYGVYDSDVVTTVKDKIIIIDAGHGGSDPGAIFMDRTGEYKEKGDNIYEKDINLAIAEKLGELLDENFDVRFTRTEDSFVGKVFPDYEYFGINERVAFANTIKMENSDKDVYFVSIHANSAEDCSTAKGSEVLYYGDGGFSTESVGLASSILDELVEMFDIREGDDSNIPGVKNRDDLGVLRVDMSSVLVEVGFMCNDEDLNKLVNRQDDIAGHIRDGIVNYFDKEVVDSNSNIVSASSTECQKEVGEKILDIAKKIKMEKNIDDVEVKSDTGYKNFECLALGIAMQESSLTHCTDSNCVDCGGSGYENVLKSAVSKCDNSKSTATSWFSYGVMQINSCWHEERSFDVFENNVKYALEEILHAGYLRYNEAGFTYPIDGEYYEGWRAAIRAYNSKTEGESDYVKNVTEDRRSWVETNFAECGDADLSSSEETCPTVKPSESVEGLSDLRKKVLAVCKELSEYKYIDGVGYKDGEEMVNLAEMDNCFTNSEYVYLKADVDWNCTYSDEVGRKYEVGTDKVFIETEQVTKEYSPKFAVNPGSCVNSELSESKKFDLLKPGDMLSIIFSSGSSHNVIFVEWVDKAEGRALVFEWDAWSEEAQAARDAGTLGDRRKYYRQYVYTDVSLKEDAVEGHPVLMAWKPFLEGETSGGEDGLDDDEENSVVQIFYDDALSDVLSYKWNEEENKVETRIKADLLFGSKVCDWEEDCYDFSRYFTDIEKSMHDDIMSKKSWEDVIVAVEYYGLVLENYISVSWYDSIEEAEDIEGSF